MLARRWLPAPPKKASFCYPAPPQGLEHGNYAAAAENLAAALQRRGQWDEARGLMHRALEARTTHVGARHPVVAVTLRKLAELELAAAAAEEATAASTAAGATTSGGPAAGSAASSTAAAAGAGAGGGAASASASGGVALKEREVQEAVAISQEAVSIAQQAYQESLDWERRRGQPEAGGGLLGWLRPSKPQLSALRRPQRPDAAALEAAQCLQTLGQAHAAARQPAAAASDLEEALQLLADAFPHGGSKAQQEQEQEQQEVAAADEAGDGGSNGRAGEEEAGTEPGDGTSAVAVIGAREQARAARVDKARHELACGLLAELLALAQPAAGGGGAPDPQHVQRRFAQEGCSG